MDFVVIGGLAAIVHGAEIPTLDVDVIYERSLGNLVRLAAALQSLEVRLRGAEDVPLRVDAILLRNGDLFTFATPFGGFDCMSGADGAPAYAELAEHAWRTTVGPYPVKVASLDDLIAMKRTTGRHKDIPKLDELIQLRKLVDQELSEPASQNDHPI